MRAWRERGAIAGIWAAVATSVFIGYVGALDYLIALRQDAQVQTAADAAAHDALVYLEQEGRSDRDSLNVLVSASHTFCVFDPSHPDDSKDMPNIKGDDPLALSVQNDQCQPLVAQAQSSAAALGGVLQLFALSEDLRGLRTFGGTGRFKVLVEVSRPRSLPWLPTCKVGDDGVLCSATAYSAAQEVQR
jgi:hypothetical protein